MMYFQLARSSCEDSLKVLEADIQHANALYIPMGGQTFLHMEERLVLGTSMLLYCHIFNGSTTTWGELDDAKEGRLSIEISDKKRGKGESGLIANVDMEREDECGICLEPCTKMVLPNCCHAMCIKCYRNWNTKSESCPFCRGSMKRVNSEDLWVLTCNDDVVDNETVSKEELLRFYRYINSLPTVYPDALFLVYYEYLI